MSVIISIITPVFNGAQWLELCLKNVASQTAFGIEHLVVDGGSKDGSVEILKSHAEEYPHLRWISESDGGQSDAMNKGVKLALGKWISFLNVDDYYEPDTLPRVLKHISRNPERSRILVGDLKIWKPDNTLHSLNRPSQMTLPKLIADQCEWPYNPTAYFYPKAIHETIGYFPEDEHFAMDYDFILKSAVAAIPFEYYPETWGNFRLLPEAKTSQDQNSNQSYLRAQKLRSKYYGQLSITQKWEVWKLKAHWYIKAKIRRLFPAF